MASTLLRGSAFITGAASGIGRQIAFTFASHGITRLALADISAESLEASVAELAKAHPDVEILTLVTDVRSGQEVKEALARVAERLGRLDVAVNNAGVAGSGKPTHETDEEEWMRVLDVNLHGVWRCQKEELAVMVKQEDLGKRIGRGTIINVSSMFGVVGPSNRLPYTPYAAAKHGVIGLTKADANTYGAHGIRINAICPGYVESPMLAAAMESDPTSPINSDLSRTPLGRMATVTEIAESIAAMASPLNSYMTGSGIVVDGGFTSS
jgi:NAD(P)-dependent dehydrogenase (short-subunit alcohol dehydrogenase family)